MMKLLTLALLLLTSTAIAAEPLTKAESDFVARSKQYSKDRVNKLLGELRDAKAAQMPPEAKRATIANIQSQIKALHGGKLIPAPLPRVPESGQIGAMPDKVATVREILGPRQARLEIGEPPPLVFHRPSLEGLRRGSIEEVEARLTPDPRYSHWMFTLDDTDTSGMKAGQRVGLPAVVQVDQAAFVNVPEVFDPFTFVLPFHPFDASKLLGKSK